MTAPQSPRLAWAASLRQARLDAGWDVHRLAVELVRAAGSDATATTESLTRRIRAWEAGRSTIRERYRLLLARVLQVDAASFTEQPAHTGEVDRIRTITAGVIALDELTGGTDLVPTAVRNARTAHQIAASTQDPRIASAAAEALQVAGWVAFDADDGLLARRLTSASVLAARAGGDHLAELFALSQLGMQDAHEQRPDQARPVCEQALSQDLSPRVRGLFELRLARAQGQEGTPNRAVTTLNRARSRLRGEAQDRDPPWTWWVTDAELDWHEAMIHADNGQWSASVDLFEAAVHGRPEQYRRGAFNDAAHLVNALARVGSWQAAEQALRVWVLPAMGQVCSGRTHTLLQDLRTSLDSQPIPPELRELLTLAAEFQENSPSAADKPRC